MLYELGKPKSNRRGQGDSVTRFNTLFFNCCSFFIVEIGNTNCDVGDVYGVVCLHCFFGEIINFLWLRCNSACLAMSWGMWLYSGHSHLRKQFWPLDQISCSLTWLPFAMNCTNCQFKFQKWSWDVEIIEDQSEDFLSSNDPRLFSNCNYNRI